MTKKRPSTLSRILLRCRPLGERRADVEADLEELFELRVEERGLRAARRRHLDDVLSLWIRRAPRPVEAPTSMPRRPVAWVESVGTDLKFALRVFQRRPVSIALAVAGLSIGIAIATTVFSVANAFNFRPLGVSDPSSVVWVIRSTTSRHAELYPWRYEEFARVRELARSVTLEASLATGIAFAETADDLGRSTPVRFVTSSFVSTFGGRALYGRVFDTSDDVSAVPVALLQHGFWQRQFGGDPSIVGRTVFMNGTPVIIGGVLERKFTGPFTSAVPNILLPLSSANAILSSLGRGTSLDRLFVEVIGHLTRPSTLPQARQELSSIAARLDWGQQSPAAVAAALDVVTAGHKFGWEERAVFALVMSIVALVLLLASTNVANLLLAGAVARQHEIAARLALGASRARIIRQLLTESVCVAVAAAAIGFVLVLWMTPLASRLLPDVPAAIDFSPDVRVYLFGVAVAFAAGLAAGFSPARFGARGSLVEAMKGGASDTRMLRKGRMRSTFLGIQAAASFVLLVLTMLFGRAALQLSTLNYGFDIEKLATVFPAAVRASAARSTTAQFLDATVDRLRALPNVESVARVEYLPFGGAFHPLAVSLNGKPYRVLINRSSSDFFATTGMRLLRGRTFAADEMRPDASVAVITANLARDFWTAGDPIGASLERVDPSLASIRVIGVVSDAAPNVSHPQYYAAGIVYQPLADPEVTRLIVRVSGSPRAMLRPIQAAVAAIDPMRRPSVSALVDDVDRSVMASRVFASVTAIFGGVALLLATIGVIGVTAFAVGLRRREIGIRMVVGANRSRVVGLVFGQGMRPVLVGLAVGVALAVAGTRVIAFALFAGVSARDPLSFAAAATVLILAAAVGVFVPALRATQVDPAEVLKR